MTLKCWIHSLLFCLCCHCEIQPVSCKPEWMSPQFPCDVTASNDSKVLFDCKGRYLHKVPHGITCNATELDLSRNCIKNISVGSVSNLLNLTFLDLSWANRHDPVIIDGNAFKNLTKLRELRLSANCLEKIPSNLPPSVEILDLNTNRITSLDNRSFIGLTNVTHLWLSKNCFFWNPCGSVTIMDNSFVVMTRLWALDLSFNNLSHVPKGLPKSLRKLNLGSNQMQHICEDDLLGLQNLIKLNIGGNCQRCENAPYPCVPCQNVSLCIHPKAFYSLTELEILNLGGNSLTHMNPSWFERLNKLKQLFLLFNFLIKAVTKEATFLRYLPQLERIDISFNFELKFYPPTLKLSKEFSNLKSLKSLYMEGLVFQHIGPDTLRPLYQLNNLSTLNMGTNFIVHSNSTIFSKMPQLRIIDLTENKLFPIPMRSYSHPSEGYGQTSDLSLSPFPRRLHPKDLAFEITHMLIKQECFDSGRVLVLSSNNLFFISPEQFKGYGDIACLNLSGNGFSQALNGTEFSHLPNLKYLDLSFNKIDLAFDCAFKELKHLQVLDLSHNAHYFEAFGVTHNLNFMKNLPVLRVLNMSYNSISSLTTKQMYSDSLAELQFTHNDLGKLWNENDVSYQMLFNNLTNLTILDISHNKIAKIPDYVYEYLPRNLTTLRVSNNWLTDFTWGNLKFFDQLQILDLSHNFLINVTYINSNVTSALAFLDLSHNRIFHLDNGFLRDAKSLHTLSLRNNKLTTINQSTFQPRPQSPIKTLFLERNPFQCTCELLDFILWIENCDVKIPKLTTQVTCDTPANQKGQTLIYFDINQCVNDNQAFFVYILTHSFIVVFMLVTTIAHLFYWDASYVLHYMRAKLSRYSSLNSTDSVYDVFVTYDTSDPHVSKWVMRNLRVKLEEEGEKHLPLCLEDRDWTPGVPLVDNLAQSIRYSRKTLFVLTEDYVKTGIFKLAMYLAHQRLLDENLDVIVVLMLEPVLQHSHFLRLRRRLCGESVVEWPRTTAAEPWFWQNLRDVIGMDSRLMCNEIYSKYFSNR